MLLGESEGQLLIVPEIIQRLGQSRNNAQLWSDAAKNNICIGTWNVRAMNQGKLDVVKQKMARVKIDILEIFS